MKFFSPGIAAFFPLKVYVIMEGKKSLEVIGVRKEMKTFKLVDLNVERVDKEEKSIEQFP